MLRSDGFRFIDALPAMELDVVEACLLHDGDDFIALLAYKDADAAHIAGIDFRRPLGRDAAGTALVEDEAHKSGTVGGGAIDAGHVSLAAGFDEGLLVAVWQGGSHGACRLGGGVTGCVGQCVCVSRGVSVGEVSVGKHQSGVSDRGRVVCLCLRVSINAGEYRNQRGLEGADKAGVAMSPPSREARAC